MDIEEAEKICRKMLLYAESQLLDYEAIAIETLLNELELKDKEIQSHTKANVIRTQKFNTEIQLKEKVIDEMAFELMRLSTVESVLAKDLKKRYCDFANDEEADCCWKTDKNCSDCMKEYVTNKVKEIQ